MVSISAGLGESEPPPTPLAFRGCWGCTWVFPARGCGRPQHANFGPACAVWVLGSPGRIPLGLRAGAPLQGECHPAPRCGPAGRPGVLETRGGPSEAGFSTGFDRCQRKASRSRLSGVESLESSRLLGGISGRIEINADLVGLESVTPRGRETRLQSRGQTRGKGKFFLSTHILCSPG